MVALRVYYDGLCPLCTREINHIKRLDKQGSLEMQDINASDFEQRFPHIDPIKADRILHGELPDGRIILGLDVTCMAWALVGKGHWFAFMRWPLVKPIADRAYLFFARHRHRVSGWFGRPLACDDRCQSRP